MYIPDPTRKLGSFGLACDYVGSGSGSDFNFRVEIGFKVIVFKFSFGNKLCNKLRVGSGSGRPVFAVWVLGRVQVCWIFCRVGLTVYIRPNVHL